MPLLRALYKPGSLISSNSMQLPQHTRRSTREKPFLEKPPPQVVFYLGPTTLGRMSSVGSFGVRVLLFLLVSAPP
jgi:hypothetical protein